MEEIILDQNCFACGQKNPSGLKLNFIEYPDENQVKCHTTITDQFQGSQGIAHGGIVATLLDEAAAYACIMAGYTCVTAELNVKYKKQLLTNTPIEIIGTFKEINHGLAMVSSRVISNGQIIALAQVKLVDISNQVKKNLSNE